MPMSHVLSIPFCRMSEDGSLVILVNLDDHLRLVSTQEDANIAEAFKRICINLQKVSDGSDPQEGQVDIFTYNSGSNTERSL